MNTTHTPQDQTSFEQLGPPGTRGDLVIVAIMRNETRRDEDRLNDRVTRPFKVFARLGKMALVSDGIEGDFGPEDGDSYLYLPQDVLAGRVRFNGGMMEFKKNAKGDYSFVEFECTATKLTDAKNQFLNFALPFLDHQAYIANCPIFIQSIRFDDLNNQVQSIDYVSPYRPVTINQHIIQFSKDLAPVFAMYREAKNSHSDFYTFLCYHKIMDGLFGKLRTEINQRARRLKVQLKHNRDLVPDDPEIAHAYRMHIGTPIKAFSIV